MLLGLLVRGFPILHLKGMRIMMLQLSGFSYNVPKTVGLIIWPFLTSSTNPSGPIHPALKQRTLGQGAHEPTTGWVLTREIL